MVCVIRCDSSAVIGSGHLMRCLTLANQLYKQENVEVHFICRDLEANLASLVTEKGFILHLLPRAEKDDTLTGYASWLTVMQRQDAEETIAVIKSIVPTGQKLDKIVVDSYALDIEWEQQFRQYTKEIFVIDDLANRHHDCDVLLDQNSYLNKGSRYIGLVPKTCKLLLGYKYALLRDEFATARKKMIPRNQRNGVNNIMVFFGGVDATNETMKTLRAMKAIDDSLSNVTINVIVGGSNPYRKEVEQFCNENVNMHYFCQVNNIAEFMAEADLAIGAGGSTTWERLYMGLPSMVIAVADNQVQCAKDCAVQGFIDYLGLASEVSENDIRAKLYEHLK